MHTNLFNIVLLAFFLTIGSTKIYSQETKTNTTSIPVNQPFDSLKIITPQPEILADTIKTDSIKPKKAFLDGKIKYKAEKYTKIDQKKKLITLYDKAELYYQDIVLKSGIIVFNYELDEVYAGRIKDSTGIYTQLPNFKQGVNTVEPDSIRFNYKTKKALIWNSRTEQGEFRVKAEIVKRENDSVYFMKNARFTTSKDVDDPEYYFRTSRVKFVPGKKVITGLTNMVIANVPTPLALPFAFFPMTETSQSGIIIPTFNDTRSQGYSLQNGGYYFALSDHYDLALLGDYYTNGSYGLRAETNYAQRYKFRGKINLRYQNNITSERGYPDYSKESIYNIQWNHSQDPKSNPNSRFSATVNMGSSKYFKQSVNQIDAGSSLNNTLNSAVTYSKTFQSVPQVQLSLSATHQQNTNTGAVSMTLPSMVLTMDGVYPFSTKGEARKGFIKNINFQYNALGENKINTVDTLLFKSGMFDDAKIGVQQKIPLSTNFKLFKYFSTTTSVNYEEVWVLETINKFYDPISQKDTTIVVKGFDSYRTASFNAGMGTTIYGTFKFGDNKKIQAIRHVMRPSISYSYIPSYDKYYETYGTNENGTDKIYTRFEGGIYGVPGISSANSIGMSLSNTFEAKVTDKDPTVKEAKKVMLLNNFNFSTSYNIIADSLKWSPLRVTGGTLLLKNKMNVNFGMTLNPYALDNSGKVIDQFNIDNGGSLFRMTNANLSINYSIASTDFKQKKNVQGMQNGGREDDLFGTNTDFTDRSDSQFRSGGDIVEDDEDKFAGFFKYELPWDLTMSYQLNYSNVKRENEITGNSLMFSVNSQITPKWKAGVSSGYDFLNKGVTFTQFRFERDLLSWRMDFNWVPLGPNAYWSFFIGIKSGVLSDIQWEKHSQPN